MEELGENLMLDRSPSIRPRNQIFFNLAEDALIIENLRRRHRGNRAKLVTFGNSSGFLEFLDELQLKSSQRKRFLI
jgi:hypothetical protein